MPRDPDPPDPAHLDLIDARYVQTWQRRDHTPVLISCPLAAQAQFLDPHCRSKVDGWRDKAAAARRLRGRSTEVPTMASLCHFPPSFPVEAVGLSTTLTAPTRGSSRVSFSSTTMASTPGFQMDSFALSEGFDIGKGVTASTLSLEHHYCVEALLDLVHL